MNKQSTIKHIKAGTKEVITTKEEFLTYDRFKFGSADIPYDPNHSYSIGRLARVILDEYSKLLAARERYLWGEEYWTFTDMDKVPGWIKVDSLKGTAHTRPFIPGRDFYYHYDIEDWYEWKFLGGAKPLWD